MLMQTRAVGVDKRWLGTVKCEDAVEPGMPEMISGLNQLADPVAANWGPGGLRAPTRTYWGWNANAAKKIAAPTLIMVGEQDDLTKSNLEYIGAEHKVFLGVACGTHFMNWEKQRRVLHKASIDWLSNGTLDGQAGGMFRADENARIAKHRTRVSLRSCGLRAVYCDRVRIALRRRRLHRLRHAIDQLPRRRVHLPHQGGHGLAIQRRDVDLRLVRFLQEFQGPSWWP